MRREDSQIGGWTEAGVDFVARGENWRREAGKGRSQGEEFQDFATMQRASEVEIRAYHGDCGKLKMEKGKRKEMA